MDLLSGESTLILRKIKQRFRSLNLLDVTDNDILPDTLYDVDYGSLSNGLTYYVRLNSKPKMRAALALAVKVGSVLEEEDERGVAHIVEHLAYNPSHVNFLQSIGADYGACQNACASVDKTIYELFVPVDKPELLSQSISILAEISYKLRVSADDLERERGAVLEERRLLGNANGRIGDASWVLTMEGSKYAERLPIGLLEVINGVTPETVERFYKKWYHMQNMALIAVGDFSDIQSVVELIKTHFKDKTPALDHPLIPQFAVPSHEEPRFSSFVESEVAGSSVMVSCKVPVVGPKTVKDYRNLLAESMFFHALNKRFFKLSRKNNPPYFLCSAAVDVLARPIKAYTMTSSCKQNGTIVALESMLIEVARVRMHGFSEREISVARALLMSEVASAYLERDQMQSSNLRDEYVEHFLRNVPVVGIEYEAQLHKTLLPDISASEVSKYSENFQTSFSCVITTIEPQAAAIEDDPRNVVLRVNSLEQEESISPWDDEMIPEEIVSIEPIPGHVVQQFEYSYIGANEMILSNGMQVCYKCTDFSDDQVLFTGFSYGGLSELQECEYISCSMGPTIAGEIGVFGHRPLVLMDMLAGKGAEVGTSVGTAYMRSFSGDCSPSDLETALQLVYQLFVTDLEPGEEDVKKVMQMVDESIRAKERDPYTAFANRVREINYGDSYFFRPIKTGDIRKVDPSRACKYFSNCFKDPSTFTVVIVGNIDPATAYTLILQYLGGIPRPPKPIMNFKREELKGLPYTFPSTVIREIVWRPMVQDHCSVQLCFPVELKHENVMEDLHLTRFISKLLEIKILHVLRFKHGQIYSVRVSVFLGGNKPSRAGNICGDISISFSCNPEISSTLVNLALDEILRLQEEGPLDDDVSTILEIEQRDHEVGLQENYYWLEGIVRSYQARTYSGDVGASFQIQDEGRIRARNSLTPLTAQSVLQRIIPFPCKKQYTLVILMPQQSSYFKKLISIFSSREAKILVGLAGLALLARSLWRYLKQSE